VDYRPAISSALQSEHRIETNSIVFFRGTPKHGRPRVDIQQSLAKFAKSLRTVDVTECPEDFRVNWIELIHTIENYEPGLNVGHSLAAGAAGAVAVRTGSKEAGDLAAREFEEVTSTGDIRLAAQRLETVCMKYGVQPGLRRKSPVK
jgi:hypothetical protein